MGEPDAAMAATKGPTLSIFFGSQTGKAEAFAQDLCDEAEQQGVAAVVVDLDEFSPEALTRGGVAVFVVANTGDGEPTDNTVKFHRWINGEQPDLQGLHFAVFGLGDRTYLHFNRVGRELDARLAALGGRRFCALGLGDDSGDILADFEAWKPGFWSALRLATGSEERTAAGAGTAATAEPELFLAAAGATLDDEPVGRAMDTVGRFYFTASWARVASRAELRPRPLAAAGESTAHVELDVSGAAALAGYSAADTLELLPENSEAEMLRVLPLLGLAPCDLDRQVGCRSLADTAETKKPFPTPCTLRDALARYCDLRSAPTKRMLSSLQRATGSAVVRERISALLASGQLLRLVQDPTLGVDQHWFWSRLLHGSGSHLDPAWFLVHCPRQRPRPYTIASSPLACPGRIHICASLWSAPVRHEALDAAFSELSAAGVFPAEGSGAASGERDSRCFGLCSQWLCQRVATGDRVLVAVRDSSFRLTKQDVPLLMVGAGAGVAPFRAFWQELAAAPRRSPATLVFGCRRADQDWIYQEEMLRAAGKAPAESAAGAAARPPLARLFTAFSRAADGPRRYVQEALAEEAAAVLECIDKGGAIYVCGGVKMGEGVLAALAKLLPGGQKAVQDLREAGRVVLELWSEVVAAPSGGAAAVEAEEGPARKRPRRGGEPNGEELSPVAVRGWLEARRSVFPKDYTGEAVPDEVFDRLLNAARWAPTHGKTEPWRFVVYSAGAQHDLIDSTLAYYRSRDAAFWREAWNGEFADFSAFQAHVEKQRQGKWLRCSHMVSICMRRQQPGEGKKLFPAHEEVIAVACAVHNMHLLAAACGIGAYWSSWFEHFTLSAEGVACQGLSQERGDLWLGVFCIGAGAAPPGSRAGRRPTREIAEWRGTGAEALLAPAAGPDLVRGGDVGVGAAAAAALIERRRSVFPKDYTGEAVAPEQVAELLAAARWAPTHGKTEPWRFVVFAGDDRNRLIDGTLDYYRQRDAAFWQEAWSGEFVDFAAFEKHVEQQRANKWLRCSHLVSICMRRQQPEVGKRQFPEHEEIASVACAVQNMHLLATAMGLGGYWSSWFDHFTQSDDGVRFNGLSPAEGDRWLGVFCLGRLASPPASLAKRRPTEEIAAWRRRGGSSPLPA